VSRRLDEQRCDARPNGRPCRGSLGCEASASQPRPGEGSIRAHRDGCAVGASPSPRPQALAMRSLGRPSHPQRTRVATMREPGTRKRGQRQNVTSFSRESWRIRGRSASTMPVASHARSGSTTRAGAGRIGFSSAAASPRSSIRRLYSALPDTDFDSEGQIDRLLEIVVSFGKTPPAVGPQNQP
jgi:hypothetical protein